MHSWLIDKALNADTWIRCGDGPTFIQLKSMIPNCDEVTHEDENPFDMHFDDVSHSVMDIMEEMESQVDFSGEASGGGQY